MMVTEVKGVREGYKMTELGEIPEEWEVRSLGEIFLINTKSVNPQKVNEELTHFSLPAYDYNRKPIVEHSSLIKSNKTLIEKDCILVSKLNPRINRTWLVRIENFHGIKVSSTEFINYIPQDIVSLKYYYHLFCSDYFQEELMLRESGSTGSRKRVTPSDTLSIIIPRPLLKEQQKIAEILATVDETIETTDQLLEKTKELKKGLMQQLLMKGIGHNEFKETELGEIPVGWDIRYMSEIGTFSKGKGIAKKDLTSTGHPCILYGELYTKYTERITNVISRTNFDSGKIEFGRVNDVLIPSSGETAIDIATSSALNVDNIAIGGDINIFRPKDNIYGSFISYSINSVRKGELSRLAQGSSVYHLYSSNLNKFKVLVPPLSEQKRIVEILSSVDDQIEGYEKEKKRLQELKKGLMQQLLTGKIRVTD